MLLPAASSAADPLPSGEADRGALLAGLAGCAACHTAAGGDPYAGGYRIETPFGVFVGTNLTPDPEYGLGAWTVDDFERALRRGKGPDHRLWPAFPFTSFTALSDQDVVDLWAHLQTVPPVARANDPHEVKRGRWQLALWRPLAFHPRGEIPDDDDRSPAWNRGRYLVDAVGHCGECHSPRGGLGGMRAGRYLRGTDAPPEPAPDITASGAAAGWSIDDWNTFLQLGMLPDGDFVGGEMGRVVQEGTSQLTPQDRAAMAAYLVELPARGR